MANNWVTVGIRKSMLKKIDDYVRGGVDPTITNTSQFIDLALREKFARDQKQ